MIFVLVALAAAVLPSLVLLWWFYSSDRFPEPPRVVWTTFGLGVLSVAPVLVVALPVMFAILAAEAPPPVYGFFTAFAAAAVPEEFFKFAVLYYYCLRHDEFDEPMDGLVYGVAASLGFATLENIIYVAGGGLWVALARAFTAVPMHAMVGAIMGYYIGQAKFCPGRRSRLLFLAWLIPMALHGLYDFPLLWLQAMAISKNGAEFTPAEGLLALALVLFGLFVLVVCVVWAVMLSRKMRRLQFAS